MWTVKGLTILDDPYDATLDPETGLWSVTPPDPAATRMANYYCQQSLFVGGDFSQAEVAARELARKFGGTAERVKSGAAQGT